MAKYVKQFNVALNQCSDIIDIEAKFLFKENLWAEVAVLVINCQQSSLKYSQAATQRDGSILKHAGMFEHAKVGNKKKKAFFNFVENRFVNCQPEDALVTTRGA